MTDRDRQGFGESPVPFRRGDVAPRQDLREVQASVAKTHFSQLLDEVERGVSFVILRHGRPVARLSPEPEGRRQRQDQAMTNIRRLAKERREQFGAVTVEEILAWRHEGHKY